ncbi:MAG TPA: hypothetical protein V6D11_15490 [Waterburya sp.]|jgi:hypothetical protein
MSQKVYAPNVHLFAFHSDDDSITPSQSHTNFNEEQLWQKCNDILQRFQVNQALKVRKPGEGFRVGLLEGAKDSGIFLPLEGKILHQAQNHRITGCACPLKIEDSYALALNLRIPEWNEQGQRTEEVDLSIFHDFNIDNCFSSTPVNNSLGQTVLLTAWLSLKQQQSQQLWQEIADNCVQNFLGKSLEKCPPLYQSGQLFGNPIFEYGNPCQPQAYGQIFVWLFIREAFNGKHDSKLDNNFGLFYQNFIDICLYKQKIIKAYQRSIKTYGNTQQKHQMLREAINQITKLSPENNQSIVSSQIQSLSNTEIIYLKDQLQTLPKIALDYSEGIQVLELDRFTIEANAKKYAEKIRKVQERLSNCDLSFLSKFNLKISENFQNDINLKIVNCVQGYSLVEKAITSIRGLVEIDKAQRDRTLEETLRLNEIASEKREQKLQIWFALVVTCLAVSSISSQVSFPVKTVLASVNYNQISGSTLVSLAKFFFYSFFDLLLHTSVGLVVALLLGVIVWLIPKPLNQSSNSKD